MTRRCRRSVNSREKIGRIFPAASGAGQSQLQSNGAELPPSSGELGLYSVRPAA